MQIVKYHQNNPHSTQNIFINKRISIQHIQKRNLHNNKQTTKPNILNIAYFLSQQVLQKKKLRSQKETLNKMLFSFLLFITIHVNSTSYGLPPILCHYMRLNVLDIEYNTTESDQRAERDGKKCQRCCFYDVNVKLLCNIPVTLYLTSTMSFPVCSCFRLSTNQTIIRSSGRRRRSKKIA